MEMETGRRIRKTDQKRSIYLLSLLSAVIVLASALPGWGYVRDSPFLRQIATALPKGNIATDAPPYSSGGTIMVPMRAVFEWLGAQVSLDSKSQQITATRGESVAIIRIGDTAASVNGTAKNMSAAAQTKSGRTFVPIRFVAEAFGAAVDWNAASGTITVRDGSRSGILRLGRTCPFDFSKCMWLRQSTSEVIGTRMNGAAGVAFEEKKPIAMSALPDEYLTGSAVVIAHIFSTKSITFGVIDTPDEVFLDVSDSQGEDPVASRMKIFVTGPGEGPKTVAPLAYEYIRILPNLAVCVGHQWITSGGNGAILRRLAGKKLVILEGKAYLAVQPAQQ